MTKKLLKQLERAIEKEAPPPPSPATVVFVREFVEVMRARHARGEVLVSTRDVMRSLECEAGDVVACFAELQSAGVQFHHTDIVDDSLPTVERRGQRFSYIGAALATRKG